MSAERRGGRGSRGPCCGHLHTVFLLLEFYLHMSRVSESFHSVVLPVLTVAEVTLHFNDGLFLQECGLPCWLTECHWFFGKITLKKGGVLFSLSTNCLKFFSNVCFIVNRLKMLALGIVSFLQMM